MKSSPGPPVCRISLIYRFGAPLFFFNAAYFAHRVQEVIEEATARPQVTFFLINAEAIVEMDVNAAEMLEELYHVLKKSQHCPGHLPRQRSFPQSASEHPSDQPRGHNLYPTLAAVFQELTKKQLEEEAREVAAAKEALTAAEEAVDQSVEHAVKEAVKQVVEAEEAEEAESGAVKKEE